MSKAGTGLGIAKNQVYNLAKNTSDEVFEKVVQAVPDEAQKIFLKRYKKATNELGNIKNPSISEFKTGRIRPETIEELVAMKSVWHDPLVGATNLRLNKRPTILTRDLVYNDLNGWEKWSKNINGTEIHFTRNRNTGQYVDFKFK